MYYTKNELNQGGNMFKVILVASGKGGTGKTSLTANISSALAERGHRVLAIDADSGLRNLDLVLGLSDSIVFSFADVPYRCSIATVLCRISVLYHSGALPNGYEWKS